MRIDYYSFEESLRIGIIGRQDQRYNILPESPCGSNGLIAKLSDNSGTKQVDKYGMKDIYITILTGMKSDYSKFVFNVHYYNSPTGIERVYGRDFPFNILYPEKGEDESRAAIDATELFMQFLTSFKNILVDESNDDDVITRLNKIIKEYDLDISHSDAGYTI